MCTAATSLSMILLRSLRPRSSSLRKVSEASERFLIAGDFNSKSPEWGKARLDRRVILVGEMVARNDLIVLNHGRDFTFRRGAGGPVVWNVMCDDFLRMDLPAGTSIVGFTDDALVVCPRMGVPGERTAEESYATFSWNQLPAKFKAERRFRGRCIGS